MFINNFIKKYKADIEKFIIFSLGTVLSSIFSYLTTKDVNFFLSEIELGQYSYLNSIFQLLFVSLSLSLSHTYIRFNNNGISLRLVKFVQTQSVIALIVFILIIYLITHDITVALFAFILFYNERMYYFRSVLDTFRLNLLLITSSVTIYILCKLYFTYNTNYNHEDILKIYGIGYLVSLLFFVFKNKNLNINTESEIRTKDILKYSIPLIGITIIDWILNFSNQYVIKLFLNYEDLAKYAIAFRSLLIIRFIASLFLLYFPLAYFRAIEQNELEKIKKIRLMMIFILFLSSLIIGLFATNVYLIMGGNKYLDSIYLFQVLLIADLLKMSASFYGTILTYEIKTYISMFIQLAGAVLNLFLSFMLIPIYGIEAAVYSNLIAYIIIFILTIAYSHKIEKKYSPR